MRQTQVIKLEKPLQTFNELYKKALEPPHLSTDDHLEYMSDFINSLSSKARKLYQRERDEKYLEIAKEFIKHPDFQTLDEWFRKELLQKYNNLKKS